MFSLDLGDFGFGSRVSGFKARGYLFRKPDPHILDYPKAVTTIPGPQVHLIPKLLHVTESLLMIEGLELRLTTNARLTGGLNINGKPCMRVWRGLALCRTCGYRRGAFDSRLYSREPDRAVTYKASGCYSHRAHKHELLNTTSRRLSLSGRSPVLRAVALPGMNPKPPTLNPLNPKSKKAENSPGGSNSSSATAALAHAPSFGFRAWSSSNPMSLLKHLY